MQAAGSLKLPLTLHLPLPLTLHLPLPVCGAGLCLPAQAVRGNCRRSASCRAAAGPGGG